MEKKKCEICGQMKPLGDFSKSYKHRCKACVAELVRNNRKNQKEYVHHLAEALNKAPVVRSQEALATDHTNSRYVIATHALQGILACGPIMSHLMAKSGSKLYERVAAEALHFTDALMAKLEDKKS
ncbi:MAG: hypothetical protein HDS87_06930 [Bacteroidales bacterium]|nr:hypothetical protein [Bacteroidales bacterium]